MNCVERALFVGLGLCFNNKKPWWDVTSSHQWPQFIRNIKCEESITAENLQADFKFMRCSNLQVLDNFRSFIFSKLSVVFLFFYVGFTQFGVSVGILPKILHHTLYLCLSATLSSSTFDRVIIIIIVIILSVCSIFCFACRFVSVT